VVSSPNGGDDAVWVFGPDKGFWFLIVVVDEAVDSGLEIGDGAEHAAFKPPLGEFSEEALCRVQPGTGRWREMESPTRMTLKPGQDLWMFVGGIVVDGGVILPTGTWASTAFKKRMTP